jgi:PST family polysaccharide transporter
MVFGTAIQQTWLFQGLEDMKLITITSVISRTVSVILIFLLVKNSNQVFLYSALYALTYLLMGVISILIAKLKYNLRFQKVGFTDIFIEIRDGWYLFTTSAMSKIFSGIGVTVLVFTSTTYNVGVYNAIYKVPLIMKMIFAPIGQVIFPYISKHYSVSFNSGITRIRKISKYIIIPFSVLGLIIIMNANLIITVLYGPEYAIYSKILVPLICWMILSIINNLLGIQVLVANGNLKEYSKAFRIGVFSIVILNVLLGINWDIMGVSLAAMLSEFVLMLAILYQIKKIKL